MPWVVIEFPVPDDIGEAAAERLKAAGADGVAEEWRHGVTYVRGFWKDAEPARAIAGAEEALRTLVEVGLLAQAPEISQTTMEDADWLEGWKQHFSPQEISPRLAIVPSWESYTPRPGQAVVVLDPGMAFGTGTHGTTYTCLQALSAYLTAGMRVADIGTGSGILAIAAVKLDAGTVTATDNDALSIRVAEENAAMNDVADRIDFRVADLLDGVSGPFDLLIANILAPVITRLAPLVPSILTPDGFFISSGYITGQEADIRTALTTAGFTVLQRYERDDWVTLVSRKEA